MQILPIVIIRAIFFNICGSMSLLPFMAFMVGSSGIPTTQKILQNMDDALLIPFSSGFKKMQTTKLISSRVRTKIAIHSLIKVARMLKLKVRKMRFGMIKAMTANDSQP